MVKQKKLGIYIHIPFCMKKCHYCDFTSFAGCGRETQEHYLRVLQEEIQQSAMEDRPVDTVFIGGGTPSVLEAGQIGRILETVNASFAVEADAEITIEANPGTLSLEKLKEYRQCGINRLSMGLQTMDEGLLEEIGRIHTAGQFMDNYRQAREAGFSNINVDLIFALPGQTFEMWRNTLAGVLDLRPEHLSFYSLQIEEGTPFYEKYRAGRLPLLSEEQDRRMYHYALETLAAKGYFHYEISNASLPGYQCRHNLRYWSMEDYLGLGLSAHSYLEGLRFSNTGDLNAYLSGNDKRDMIHKNNRQDSITDYLFTGMRKIGGIDREDFRQRYGQEVTEIYGEAIKKNMTAGLIELTEESLRFTRSGLDLSNAVLRDFMTA